MAAMTSAPSATNQMKTQAGMLRPQKVQLTTAHSPEPVKIIAQAVEPAERVHDVVEARAARGHLGRRQILHPDVPARNAHARERRERAEHRVRARAGAARRVQRRDGEHDAERDHRHALQDAERARLETDDVLLRRARSS